MPPATTTSASPSAMACAPEMTAFRPEPQTLLSVQHGTLLRQAGEDRGLAGGRLPDPRLQDVPHHDLVDRRRRPRPRARARRGWRPRRAAARSPRRASPGTSRWACAPHRRSRPREEPCVPSLSGVVDNRDRHHAQSASFCHHRPRGGRRSLAGRRHGRDAGRSRGWTAPGARAPPAPTSCAQVASALDAVELAVRLLEDDPLFNAGTGSTLTAAGDVELDASIMDGETLRCGAVAVVKDVRNPVVPRPGDHGADRARDARRPRGVGVRARGRASPSTTTRSSSPRRSARAGRRRGAARRRARPGRSARSRATSAATSPRRRPPGACR